MAKRRTRRMRWLAVLCLATTVAGCGGGGGGATPAVAAAPAPTVATPPPPPPPPDSRNGEYVAYAANGRTYALSLNFDTRAWRVAGNGTDAGGTLAADGNQFDFEPVPAGTVANTARFSHQQDTVAGGLRIGSDVVPFVASRNFVTTITEAVGNYNFLATTVDTQAAPNNSIFTGEITGDGLLRQCNDTTIFVIAKCPAASVVTSTLTTAGPDFTSTSSAGSFVFRVARVGTEKVLLRASPSSSTGRRFWMATPAANAFFSPGTFNVVNNSAQAGTLTFTTSTATFSGVAPNGTAVALQGATGPVGFDAASNSPMAMSFIEANAQGRFFAVRSTWLVAVVGTRGSTIVPGFVELGMAR